MTVQGSWSPRTPPFCVKCAVDQRIQRVRTPCAHRGLPRRLIAGRRGVGSGRHLPGPTWPLDLLERLAALEQHPTPDAPLVPAHAELEAELPDGAVTADLLGPQQLVVV